MKIEENEPYNEGSVPRIFFLGTKTKKVLIKQRISLTGKKKVKKKSIVKYISYKISKSGCRGHWRFFLLKN